MMLGDFLGCKEAKKRRLTTTLYFFVHRQRTWWWGGSALTLWARRSRTGLTMMMFRQSWCWRFLPRAQVQMLVERQQCNLLSHSRATLLTNRTSINNSCQRMKIGSVRGWFRFLIERMMKSICQVLAWERSTGSSSRLYRWNWSRDQIRVQALASRKKKKQTERKRQKGKKSFKNPFHIQ